MVDYYSEIDWNTGMSEKELLGRDDKGACVRRYGVGGGKGRIILHPMKFFCVQICYSPWKEWTQREQSYAGGVKIHLKIK